ncbi:hypothetical protein ZN11_20875 [Salmonella enterica]|uniref:Uncharacterized protein n=1 Tax=Salmonella oranienberg TaxID=28147 RepID=A0A730ARA6_SALON|nr:hypothetical protein [Salmonella enterica]EBB0360290.1 hypothetical protein [Salmonella enterica subsp. enterica serovar Rubislaw]ECS7333333.1 hypothetical protein [Salmonella enterica subsp. enterica serovar Berta]EEJ1461359.1 hypothetical protein [Salmonella enterica subsp. enterica serovar Virginia]HAE3616566.1 hypothetical protein [Salmonella enterica subsp. enterica serovar Oranienburg]
MVHQLICLIGAGGVSKVFHMFLNQSCLSQKTKATPKDRQWLRTKPEQFSRYPAGGLVKIIQPQIEGERCCQMVTVTRVQKCALDYSGSLGFRRWRRLISPLAAVTRKPAVLSPSSFTCSISSRSSSGSLTDTCSDLLFFLPVAITDPPVFGWCSVCTKKNQIQLLTWCSPVFILVVFTLFYGQKTAKPGSARTLTGLLTTNDS